MARLDDTCTVRGMFFVSIINVDAETRAAGVALLTSGGFSTLVAELAVWLASRTLGEPRLISPAVAHQGGVPSAGTLRSYLGEADEPVRTLRDGRWILADACAEQVRFGALGGAACSRRAPKRTPCRRSAAPWSRRASPAAPWSARTRRWRRLIPRRAWRSSRSGVVRWSASALGSSPTG